MNPILGNRVQPDKTDLIEAGLFGGIRGGPIGPVASVNIKNLGDEDRAKLEAALEALKGDLTYEKGRRSDFGCRVSHSGSVIFTTRSFQPIPDQFFQLKELVQSLSRQTEWAR